MDKKLGKGKESSVVNYFYKKNFKNMIFSLLIIYLMILVYITLIHENDYVYGNAANLDLFSTIILMWKSSNPYLIIMNVFGNIALFTPMGFFISILVRRLNGPIQILIVGLITSFLIETLQYKVTNRVFDVDDIFLNTIGTLIGWVISRVMCLILHIFWTK